MDVDRARRTLGAMVRARGYTDLTFPTPTRGRATGRPGHPDIFVAFCIADPKLGVKPLRDLPVDDEPHVLVVYRGTMTSFARQKVVEMAADRIVETFAVGELQFDIQKHVLVPPHVEVPPRAVRKRGILVEQLPLLLQTDPVVKWHRWPRGTVVRVTRANPEGHAYVEYRVVGKV